MLLELDIAPNPNVAEIESRNFLGLGAPRPLARLLYSPRRSAL